jgi:hypothetical protein
MARAVCWKDLYDEGVDEEMRREEVEGRAVLLSLAALRREG